MKTPKETIIDQSDLKLKMNYPKMSDSDQVK